MIDVNNKQLLEDIYIFCVANNISLRVFSGGLEIRKTKKDIVNYRVIPIEVIERTPIDLKEIIRMKIREIEGDEQFEKREREKKEDYYGLEGVDLF